MQSLRGLVALGLAGVLQAQVVGVRGGGSSLYDGYGLAADVWGNRFDGWLGAGYQDRWRVGGFVRYRGDRDTVRLGNDVLTLRLPTDVFGDSYHILVQGLTVLSGRGRVRASAFAGASATGVGVPLFAARHADAPFGALVVDDSGERSVRFGGTAILASRSTFMVNAEWEPTSASTLALSTGTGAGKPYVAASGAAEGGWWAIKSSLIASKPGFRRAALPIPPQTGLDGVNAELTLRRGEWGYVLLSRHAYVSDSGPSIGTSHANGSSIVVGAMSTKAHAASGVYVSRSSGGRNVSAYVAAGWLPSATLGADLYVLQSHPDGGPTRTMPAAIVRERVTQRLTLDQTVTGFGKGMSVALGGSYIGRLGDYSLTYQIVNDPFDAVNPFKRTLSLAVRMQLGDYNASVGSVAAADGTVSYSASAERYLYLGGANGAAPAPLRIRMDRYLVTGFVRDTAGLPVAGAAIQIGDELLFTDSRGAFFVRLARRTPQRLAVVVDQFMALGRYEVVSAPDAVTPVPEGTAQPVAIVVRRR